MNDLPQAIIVEIPRGKLPEFDIASRRLLHTAPGSDKGKRKARAGFLDPKAPKGHKLCEIRTIWN